jgi:phosphopantetheine--protein transferase-like protein
MRQLKEMRMAERFFSRAERQSLLECSLGEERTDRFYRLWVKKEAYAKLTGEGIAATVGKDTEELSEIVEWQEYREPEGYRMALCRYKSC